MTGQRELELRSCVCLRGRRDKTVRGPLLYTDDDGTADGNGYSLFVVVGNGVRVEGLWLRGAQGGRRSPDLPVINATACHAWMPPTSAASAWWWTTTR